MKPTRREQIRAALERHFERTTAPRTALGLIVIATGIAGYFISHTLLHFGETKMALRYPLSVLGAYAVFLGLVRIWAEYERGRMTPEDAERAIDENAAPLPFFARVSSGGSRWFDVLDGLSSGADFGEGCFFLIAFAILGCAVAFVISSAPALLADVFIDTFLVTLLYRRLKAAEQQHWLGTAIRHTKTPMIVAAAALSLIGLLIQWHWPLAKSIGDIFRQ